MRHPVMVNGRDYDRNNIIQYLKENANVDPQGKLVNTKDSTSPIRSSLNVIKTCKKARWQYDRIDMDAVSS